MITNNTHEMIYYLDDRISNSFFMVVIYRIQFNFLYYFDHIDYYLIRQRG